MYYSILREHFNYRKFYISPSCRYSFVYMINSTELSQNTVSDSVSVLWRAFKGFQLTFNSIVKVEYFSLIQKKLKALESSSIERHEWYSVFRHNTTENCNLETRIHSNLSLYRNIKFINLSIFIVLSSPTGLPLNDENNIKKIAFLFGIRYQKNVNFRNDFCKFCQCVVVENIGNFTTS